MAGPPEADSAVPVPAGAAGLTSEDAAVEPVAGAEGVSSATSNLPLAAVTGPSSFLPHPAMIAAAASKPKAVNKHCERGAYKSFAMNAGPLN
jgi:hypothetical protein